MIKMEDLLKQLLVGQNKLVESVGNIEKKLVEHDEQFEILRADVKSLKAEQREMKEGISNIKENQQEMQEDISQIKTTVGYIWGDIGKLDKRVSRHYIQLAK